MKSKRQRHSLFSFELIGEVVLVVVVVVVVAFAVVVVVVVVVVVEDDDDDSKLLNPLFDVEKKEIYSWKNNH